MQAILSEVKLQVPLHKEKERVKDAFIYTIILILRTVTWLRQNLFLGNNER